LTSGDEEKSAYLARYLQAAGYGALDGALGGTLLGRIRLGNLCMRKVNFVIVIVENYESHCLVLPNTAASSIVTLWLEVFFHDSIYGTAVYC
jgi:hypothetical protein